MQGLRRSRSKRRQLARISPSRASSFRSLGRDRGCPADKVLPALIRGVNEFLRDVAGDQERRGNFHLSEIYFAAYLDEDAKFA